MPIIRDTPVVLFNAIITHFARSLIVLRMCTNIQALEGLKHQTPMKMTLLNIFSCVFRRNLVQIAK